VKRHAPDRIVVGEVRGPEVMYMLEAASDGIAGTMCTLHAQSSRQTFEKLVNYARRGGANFDRSDVLQTAAFALDLIVYLDLTPDGRRVVAEITQVCDYDATDNAADVTDVIVDGRPIVRDGQHRLGDVGRLLADAIDAVTDTMPDPMPVHRGGRR
jgi:Flp pilus assembly CpaF family ATPase